MTAKYAEGTTTSVDATEAEIRRTLKSYGVTSIIVGHKPGQGVIDFELRGRHLRYEVTMPPKEEFREYEVKGSFYPRKRTDQQLEKAYQAEERRRWRVLLLHIKSQLNLLDDDAMDMEDVFLANLVLPDGTRAGQAYKQSGAADFGTRLQLPGQRSVRI